MGLKLSAAISIAANAHGSQRDKQGQPYILHPLRVMLAVKDLGEDAMCAAVLHDVIEDQGEQWDVEIAKACGRDVLRRVYRLSKLADPETTYEQYLEWICKDETARKIKVADVLDNLSRIAGLEVKEQDRLSQKYNHALIVLGERQL